MNPSRISQVRIDRFKSYKGSTLDIHPLTLIVGRNGSGKSNSLDAIALLALLADGRELRDLERGDLEVSGLRGGLSGAVPFHGDVVALGVDIDLGDERALRFDVELDSNYFEVQSETLTLIDPPRKNKELYKAAREVPGSGLMNVSVYSGAQPRQYTFLSGRLVAGQIEGKVLGDTTKRQLVIESTNELLAALRGIFALDPNPSQMRSYVRLGSLPERSGATLAAQLYALQDDAGSWERLESLAGSLIGDGFEGLTFSEAKFPGAEAVVDVMVAMNEKFGQSSSLVTATNMSDGTLRYLSIIATLITLSKSSSTRSPGVSSAGRTILIEEIENGLFPNQASRILELLKQEAAKDGITLIVTTHSPAMLDALQSEDHEGVTIVERNSSGHSALARLVEHDRYVEIARSGKIGQSLSNGRLEGHGEVSAKSIRELLR